MITFAMKAKMNSGSTAAISIRVMAFPCMSHLSLLSASKHCFIFTYYRWFSI